VTRKIPLSLIWLLPVLALIPLAYSLMPFWTKWDHDRWCDCRVNGGRGTQVADGDLGHRGRRHDARHWKSATHVPFRWGCLGRRNDV